MLLYTHPNPLPQDDTLNEAFLEQVFKHSLTKEGRHILSEKLDQLSLPQINILLFHIAKIGDYKTMQTLVKFHNLDFNLVDEEGRTPVFFAAIGNHLQCVKLLVKHGSMVHRDVH